MYRIAYEVALLYFNRIKFRHAGSHSVLPPTSYRKSLLSGRSVCLRVG